MKWPSVMQDTRGRCIEHLRRVSELVNSLEAAPESDRLRALGSFKELMGLLATQKAIDEGNANVDVKRASARLASQKHSCSRENESRIKHLRKKIATTATLADRLSLEEVLRTLENLSIDDECKWDVNIMRHWFDSFKDQKPVREGTVVDTHVRAEPTVTDTHVRAEPTVTDTHVKAEPTVTDTHVRAESRDAAIVAEGVSPLVSSAMQEYDREVMRFVARQLLRVETEIESLRKQHLQAYLSDVDNTLGVIETVASSIDAAAIKAKVLAARSDAGGSALGTLLDTVQQQYERDSDELNREWWRMLIKSVTVLRDFNYKRNTLLSERTKLVVQDMDDSRDAIVAGAMAVAKNASTLQNKNTRLYVAGVIDDVVRRLRP